MRDELKVVAIMFSVFFFLIIMFIISIKVPPGYVEPQLTPLKHVNVSKVEHNGHFYLILLGFDGIGQYGFCHDPDCNCGANNELQ